jgi:hypothetical protein
MAIACCGDLAPCLPRRILRISSWTNSPACVLGDLPARLSFRAFAIARRTGMIILHSSRILRPAVSINAALLKTAQWTVPRKSGVRTSVRLELTHRYAHRQVERSKKAERFAPAGVPPLTGISAGKYDELSLAGDRS